MPQCVINSAPTARILVPHSPNVTFFTTVPCNLVISLWGRHRLNNDGTGGTISRLKELRKSNPYAFGLPPVVTTTMSAVELLMELSVNVSRKAPLSFFQY